MVYTFQRDFLLKYFKILKFKYEVYISFMFTNNGKSRYKIWD
jgi:hypothetical protein